VARPRQWTPQWSAGPGSCNLFRMTGYNIAVVGATGAVGQVFLSMLAERQFPINSLRLCASQRSVGRSLVVNARDHAVELVTDELLAASDFVFISATSQISQTVGRRAANLGAVAIDDSSVFRMDPDVPLVVPEVNAADLERHKGIVSIPNCSTTPLAMVLDALGSISRIQRVIVDTYQSVSGTGSAAVQELLEQSERVLAGSAVEPDVYPHQIAFNTLPHIDDFRQDGYTKEERKMIEETRKILNRPDLPLSATCVRIPVTVGHSEAVHIEFAEPVDPAAARSALAAYSGIALVDDPAERRYPMPIDSEGEDDVLVGRVRADASHPNGLALWLSSDNLRKGAALNAIQIAEEMVRRRLVNPRN
jgi:aspartate-semialdehyde dehydrogenase